MEKRKRNKAQSRSLILQAGLAVFSERGYDAATTKMIAARSGLNESLIQRYFKSKAGLLAAVNKMSMEAMMAQHFYPPQATPEEEIFQFMKNRMEQDGKNLQFVRVVISRVLIDEKLRKEMPAPPKRFFLHERLEAFKEQKLIDAAIDVTQLAEMIMSQSFIVGMLESLMFRRSERDCLKRFRTFAGIVAIGIAPRS